MPKTTTIIPGIEMYKIVRTYLHHPSRTLKRGVTLQEAQAHCKDPETSSSTCTSPELVALTERMGQWFDSYDKDH